MATKGDFFDPTYSPVRRSTGIDTSGFSAGTQAGLDITNRLQEANTAVLTPPPEEDDEPDYDLAVDPIKGKVYTSVGEFDGTPDNLYALYDAVKEGKIKPLGKAPRGMVGSTFDEYLANIDATPHEGVTARKAAQGFLGGLGAASKAIDLTMGSDAPDSVFSDAAESLRQGETMGQRAAERAHFWESPQAFGANIGEFGGNVASTLLGTGGGALVGSAAGPGGTAAGALAGGAIAGGGMTAGDAGEAAYGMTLDLLDKMPEPEVQEMTEYRLLQAENPDATHQELKQMLATEAAQAAMIPGAALGAGEAFVGGKLGGRILRTLGLDKMLGAAAARTGGGQALATLEQAAKPISRTARVLKATARGSLAGTGEALTEVSQTALPAAYAASQTGIGSMDPMDYASMEEVEAVLPGAFLMGAFAGGGRGPDQRQVAQQSAIGQALLEHDMPPRRLPPPTRRLLEGPGNVIEMGQYEEPGRQPLMLPPPQRQIEQQPQDLLGYMDIPHRDELTDRRGEIADQAQEIAARRAPFEQPLPFPEQVPEQGEIFNQPPPAPEQNLPWNIPPQTPQQGQLPMGQSMQQAPQDLFNPEPGTASEPRGVPPQPNLAERRAFQQIQGQEAPIAEAPTTGQQLALPAPAGTATEAQIQELEAKRAEVVQYEQEAANYAASAQRGTNEWRAARRMLRTTREDIAAIDDQIDALSEQWASEREQEGPRGVRPSVAVEPSPAPQPPPAAPQEMAPSGNRPMGVAPAPTVNPVPPSPGEAASRAQTQARRRGTTGEPVVPPAPPAPAGVTREAFPPDEGPPVPGTPEPQVDIAAQIAALKDPASGRTAVLVQPGNVVPPGRLPKGVKRYPGAAGILLTADPVVGEKYRAGKLSDKALGKVLGAVAGRTEAALTPGATVVQAVTPAGAVQAEQVAKPGAKGAAAKAVSKQAQKGATVREVTGEQMQARRAAAQPAKAEAAAATSKAKQEVPGVRFFITGKMKESLKDLGYTPGDILKMKPQQAQDIIDDERRKPKAEAAAEPDYEEIARQKTAEARKGKQGAQKRESEKPKERKQTVGEKLKEKEAARRGKRLTPEAQQAVEVAASKIAEKRARTAIAATSQTAAPAKAETADTLTKMAADIPAVVTTGAKGTTVDTRVVTVDPAVEKKLKRIVENEPTSKKGKDAKKQLTLIQQFKIAVSAATDAAVDAMKKSFGAKDRKRMDHAMHVEMEAHEHEQAGKPGRPREKPAKSPLLYVPLTVAETRGFLHAARKEARAERKKYNPEKSVYRQMIEAMYSGVRTENAMGSKDTAKRWLDYLADKNDADLEQILATTHTSLKNNAFAKQVMRGATEVNHAIERVGKTADEIEAMSRGVRITPQVTVHEGVPDQAASLLGGWVSHFERGGNKFTVPVHLMSMTEAKERFPDTDFGDADAGFMPLRSKITGKLTGYMIAVDTNQFNEDPLAFAEAMGHEYGHMVVEELYSRADERTKKMLENSYHAFLRRQEGHFAADVIMSEMTPHLRGHLDFSALNVGDRGSAYVRKFHEWGARNVALYLMDPQRPVHSVLETFWKKAADMLRAVWASVTGHPKPDPAWQESVDRWIAGTMVIEPSMPATRVAFPGAPDAVEDLDAISLEPAHDAENDDSMDVEDMGDFETEWYALDTGKKQNDDVLNQFLPEGGPQKLGAKLGRVATDGISGIRGLWDPVKEGKGADWLKSGAHSLLSMRGMVRKLEASRSEAAEFVKGWMRNMNQKAAVAKEVQERAAHWVRKASQLTKKQQAVLEQIMAEATTYGIHPDIEWQEKDPAKDRNKHLRVESDRVRAENRQRYNALRHKWNALVGAEPTVEQIYKGMRDEIQKLHRDSYKMREARINNSNLSEENKKKARHMNHSLYMREQSGPYFPKKRFGKWVVTVKLPHERIGVGGVVNGDFFATEEAAREEAKQQKAMHPDAKLSVEKKEDGWAVNMDVRAVAFYESQAEARSPKARKELMDEVRERYKDAQGGFEAVQKAMGDDSIISEPFMKRTDFGDSKSMGAAFGSELAKLMEDPAFPTELAEELRFLQYQSLPENNYTKQLLPRNNIIGASKDMLRSYTVGMQASANNYARLKHGREIDENWEKAWAKARKTGDASAQRVLNELKANQEEVAKRERDTIGEGALGLTSQINSVYSLGFSIPYALSNMTQPWMVAAPVLGAFANGRTGKVVGQIKAMKYMKDAYGDTFGFFSKRAVQETVAEWRTLRNKPRADFDEAEFQRQMIDKFARTKDGKSDPMMKDVLEHLYKSGLLDYTFISAMSDAAKASGGAGQRLAQVQRLSMAFPAQIEAMNRLVTAKAATNLARDEYLIADVKSHSEMMLFVEDIVAQTQGDYSRANRARVFNKPMLGVALQFKQYMQMMYEMFAHNIMQTVRPNATKAERMQALRTIRNLMMTHAAVAGTSGLGPVSMVTKLMLWMAFSAFGDEDDEWKTTEQLQSETLKDLLGDTAGEVVDQGLPRLLGWDLGDRQSFPDLLDTRFLGIKEGAKPSEGVDKILAYAAGAPYANLKRLLDGGRDLAAGRGWDASKALPSGLRPVVQSARMAQQGMVDYDGDVVIPASDLNWNDMAIKALGGSPARVARKYEEQREVKGTTARIMAERKRIMQDARNGDIEWDDVQAYNKTVRKGFQISKGQLAQAMRAKGEREAGKVPKQEATVRKMLGY
jgi:hypothetical protein